MSRPARALVLAAALLLGALYVTPLWSVRLVAPQYPEGLGMNIRLHTVEGVKEHDLRNINSLNRYIGMRPIEPDAIPELRYMPWITAALIGAGVLVALAGRRRLLVAWTTAFALLGAAGLYDFWRWGHDYGHNLDVENAIIVVPGMTYQPPLVGTKQLLNFTATSLPALGGVAAGLALALGIAALFLSYRRSLTRASTVATAAIAAACASGTPQAIALGVDACVECRMVISDPRFGAVLVTGNGKSLKFDSVDCLLAYLEKDPGGGERAVWVVGADQHGGLVPARDAYYVRGGELRPPMGSVVAYAMDAGGSGDTTRPFRGIVLSWPELREQSGVLVDHAR